MRILAGAAMMSLALCGTASAQCYPDYGCRYERPVPSRYYGCEPCPVIRYNPYDCPNRYPTPYYPNRFQDFGRGRIDDYPRPLPPGGYPRGNFQPQPFVNPNQDFAPQPNGPFAPNQQFQNPLPGDQFQGPPQGNPQFQNPLPGDQQFQGPGRF